MGANAPPPPDYKGLAQQQAQASQANVNAQTQANRPNIQTQFGSQQWSQGPDGQWTLTSGFSPGLQGVGDTLTGQAAANMASPFDFRQFGALDNGSGARQQAIDASYNQATSRLNPQWEQRDEQLKAQLANQGLDPNSQASRAAMLQQGQARNDAYGSAMNSAIQSGTEAQQATFQQNLMARQQAIAEALRQRGMPMEQLQQLQQLAGQMPGFNAAGLPETPNLLGAGFAQGSADMERYKMQQQQAAESAKAATDMFGSVLKLGLK